MRLTPLPTLERRELEMVSYGAQKNQKPHSNGVSCPYCSSVDCLRSVRRGGWDFFRRLFGMFPWNCRM